MWVLRTRSIVTRLDTSLTHCQKPTELSTVALDAVACRGHVDLRAHRRLGADLRSTDDLRFSLGFESSLVDWCLGSEGTIERVLASRRTRARVRSELSKVRTGLEPAPVVGRRADPDL